jgi:hypothetical protein
MMMVLHHHIQLLGGVVVDPSIIPQSAVRATSVNSVAPW